MIIVGMPNSFALARRIAERTRSEFSKLNVKRFPDGEIHLRYMADVKRKKVVLVQTLIDPNESLMEVVFAARTAKDLGARKVVLVAPYLAYMRQDIRFRKGDCINAKVNAELLSHFVDELITIDPHLHRIEHLKDIFSISTTTLTADPLIASYLKKIKHPLIIGPDEESFQWAQDIARMAGCRSIILHKRRYSSTHVEIEIEEDIDFRKFNVVMVDDMISTGHTMFEVIKDVRKLGAKKITCIAVHGLFTNNAFSRFKRFGVSVVTCNTIAHKTNRIDVSGIISEVL